MAQSDIDTAVAGMTAAITTLTSVNDQVKGLGVNTSALVPATTALAAIVSTLQTTITSESSVANPPAAIAAAVKSPT